ncbi:GNAT family N-acetyltransferase [Segetibacter koreensis]|uniref:GNAT family N-acetyltransferase n=1 Tax=Segetibacter koreensis TaxID=398037 RepID=UPI00037BB8D2|nr:GNAT family N-acetyltransferase [Segetibacter koreensis]
MITIKPILKDCNELSIIRDLFEEYLKELNENLCFQSFDEELQNPLKKYGSPSGSLLLAFYNDEPAGCIALQPLSEKGICEMKRLYVRPQFRQVGLGDLLVQALLAAAKEKGYNKMVLDTLERLQPAIRLYVKHGFENTSAYYKNPLPNVVYMQKVL